MKNNSTCPLSLLPILLWALALSGCGGGSSTGSSAAAADSVAAAPASIGGVWWAVDAAPAYALAIEQIGSNLQLGDESAKINGRQITMTSINGSGSVSADGTQLELTWHFPGYGTVQTQYHRVADVLAAASSATIPHHESLVLNGSMAVRSFTLTDSEQVFIETSGPADGDTWMFLFDEQMRLVAEADDPGLDFYATMDEMLSAGTYYIVITEWDDDLTCDLDISVGIGS